MTHRTACRAIPSICVAVALAVLAACTVERRSSPDEAEPADAPYQSEVDEGLGAAVAILIDTSGSMKEDAPGDTRSKYEVAREKIERMLDATDAFVARRPDFPIKIGLYGFSSDVNVLQPIQPYNRDRVRAALATLRRPGGGTAIGDAMREARPDLYRAGVFRKYILVVTDGENTNGREPDQVARDIWGKSEHAVQIYFIAFDTSAEKFAFLEDVGGDVIAATSGTELQAALENVYQGKILAEAIDAGEREPVKK